MDTFPRITTVVRRISLLALLAFSVGAYLFSALFFAALPYDKGLDYRIVMISLGYALLLFAVGLEFVALRFVARGMSRARIVLACLIPFLLAVSASAYLISIRNEPPPPSYHRPWFPHQ